MNKGGVAEEVYPSSYDIPLQYTIASHLCSFRKALENFLCNEAIFGVLWTLFHAGTCPEFVVLCGCINSQVLHFASLVLLNLLVFLPNFPFDESFTLKCSTFDELCEAMRGSSSPCLIKVSYKDFRKVF